jgi:hypothetical protein
MLKALRAAAGHKGQGQGGSLIVSMSDSVNLGTTNAPAEGSFQAEGMIFSVTGGVGPYTFNIEVVQWREHNTGWTVGCGAQPFGIVINGATTNIGSCQWERTGQASLDLANTKFEANGPQRAYEFDCIITVTDSLSNTGSDTFIGRTLLAY